MANSGRIQYEVGFRSNTSGLAEAQKGLLNLQKTLNEIQHMRVTAITTPSSTNEEITNANQRIAEAKRVGAQIEQILQKSYNPKLNTINISTFNNELKKTTYTVESIQRAFSNIGPVGVKAFRQLTSEISKVQIKVKQTNKIIEDIKTTMVNTVRWGITSSMWNNMTGSIEKAWGFAKKLDSSLNDIRIVTGKSAEDMEKFAVQANKAAKTLGSSTTDYTNASLIYYQQGLSDAEVKARTETTLKTANVTGQSTAEVSEQLTAVWNGYKVSAREAEAYVDKLSAVAATTASDLEELSTGMSKVASAASIMGVGIDQLNAQLATIVSVTRQAPESVGTALKTIYARMGDIAAGLDTETTLGSYTKEMKAMGFNVLDANNNLKDMGEVIEEIGGKWSTLSREQQVALSQTMAGTRQYNNLLSLFDNWDMYTQALETSKNSAGTLQEQQDTFMESTEAHLQKLTTESENLYNSLFNANTINPFLDALTNLLSLLTNFVDGIGGIVPILGTLGSVGLRVFSSQIGEGLGTAITNFKEASKNAEELKNQFELLDSFSKSSSDDIVKKQSEVGKSIVQMAQQGIITQERADELQQYVNNIGELGNKITDLKKKEEDYNRVAEGQEALKREGEGTGLLKRLDQAIAADKSAGIDTTEAEKDAAKLENIFNKIAESRDQLIKQRNLNLSLASPEELQDLQKENAGLKDLNEILKEQFGIFDQLDANTSKYTKDLEKLYEKVNAAHADKTDTTAKNASLKGKAREGALSRAGSVNRNIQDLEKEYKKYNDYLSEEQKKNIAEMQKQYLEAFDNIKKKGSSAADELDFIQSAKNFKKAYEDAIGEVQEQISSIREAAEQSASGVAEATRAQIGELENQVDQEQENFKSGISAEELKQKIQLITDLAGSIGSVVSAVSMVSDVVNVLMDENATTEGKIKKVITLLAAAVPLMLTGFSGIKASLIGLLPAGASAAVGVTAAGAAATASGTAAAGAAAGFTALWAAMGPIGWIILGITAAVAGFTVVASLMDKQFNADAIAAEKAAEAYNRATEAASTAEEAYSNLKDTLSKYDTEVKGLEDLTKGTDEYKEAVQNANAAVLELIENGDILASSVYRDENGVLVISQEAREKAERAAEERRNNTAAAANYAHAESVAAQQKSDRTDFDREQAKIIDEMSLAENRWKFDTLREELISSSQEKGEVLSFGELSQTETYQNLYDTLFESFMSIGDSEEEAKKNVNERISNFYKALAGDIDDFVKEANNAGKESSLYVQEAVQNSLLNDETFASKTTGQQSVISTQYAKKIDISEDNEQYQQLKEQAKETVKALSDNEIKAQYANYMGYTLQDGKIKDSSGNEITYSKEDAKTTLEQKYVGENIKDYDKDYYSQIEKVVTQAADKIEKAGFDEQTGDALLNLLTATSSGDRKFDSSSIDYEDYEKLMSMTEEDLQSLISGIDFSAFDISADEFVDRIQQGIKNTDWTSTFASMVKSAEASVKLVNDAIDDFKIGEKLDDDTIAALEQKFPELTKIWDKTSKEYYDALRQAQEKAEQQQTEALNKQGGYEYSEIGDAYDTFQDKLDALKTESSKTFEDIYDEAYDEVARTEGEYIDAAEKAGYVETRDDGTTIVNTGEYGETEAGQQSAEYINYQDAKHYAGILKEINTAKKEGKELTDEQIDQLNKDYDAALDDATEAAKNLKNEVEETFKADYNLEISITNDIVTDVDDIVASAENAKTAVSLIGDGFKVAASNSEELFKIFPELAHNAKVLKDGTIQLDSEVTDAVLSNNAEKIDSDTDVTAKAIDNRIAELEADKAAMESKLEDLHNTSVAEFDVQSFLGENYQDFKKEEVNANAIAAQDEVANSALSAKAVISNWEAKMKAAAQYAEIAKQAEAPGHEITASTSVQDYVDSLSSSVETQNNSKTEEERKAEEEALAQTKQELYDLTEEYLVNKIASDEKQIAQLVQSKSELYAGIQSVENAAKADNVDLLKDEIDRYHDINIELDDMAKAIDRVSKAQEHLVGKDLIVAQEQELKLLAKNIKLRKEKLKIQQEEAKELQGHLIADGVTFNDDGSVANYAQIMKEKIAEVNAAKVKAANDESYKDTADAIEKNYEEFKKNFERYEAVRDEIEDLTDEITDALYEQIAKKVAAFTAKISVKLDTAKAEKEWKEFTNKLFIPTNDALAQMQAQNDLLKSDRSIASKATSNYDKLVQQGLNAQALVDGTAKEGTKSAYAIWDDRLNDGKGGYRFDEAKWKEDIDAALQESQDAILQILDDVESMGSTYIDLLEQTISAQKEQLAIYDDMNSLLNHAMKLQELFTGENDYEAKGNFYKEQQRIARDKTQNALERRQWASDNIGAAQQDYLDAKAKYDAAVASGEGDTTALEKYLDTAKQKYEDIKNELKESTEDFYTSIEEQIEAAKNVYTNTINKAMADMEKKFTGNKGLSYISDEWDLINKNADRYLDTVNSTYEVQSLQAKYQKSIDSTDSLSAQKKLKKAMEEEIKLLQEKDKLSQYDIDRANKKYELTLKQIALEEAQANKSTMRLRRDSQGNYSYQFVADEDAISDAQQELLAAQNELYNFDKERYQQTLDDALAAYQEYQQKMLEAAQINDPEERAAKEKLITEQYQQYILSITQDNEDVKKNLQESTFEALKGQYDINEQNFEAMTKGMFDDFSQMTVTDMPGCMETLVTGWNGSVQEMVDKMGNEEDGFAHEASNALEIIKAAGEELDAEIKTLGDNFSGDGGVADNILNDVKQINDDLSNFKTTVLDPTVEEGKEKLPDAWAEYKEGVSKASKALKTLSKRLETAYDKASSLYDELQKVAKQSPIDVEVRYNQVTTGTTPSGTHDTGGSGSSGGENSTTPAEEDEDKYIGTVITWKKKINPWKFKDSGGNPVSLSMAELWGEDIERLSQGRHPQELQTAMKNAKIEWEVLRKDSGRNSNSYLLQNKQTGAYGHIETSRIASLDTGGYTGEWGSDGRMAMLHEKEIVLNKEDTANILDAVSIVRNIGSLISALNTSLVSGLSGTANIPNFGNNTVDQNVHIEANFPNVTNSSEIEDALNNLVNIASQRAFSTKR